MPAWPWPMRLLWGDLPGGLYDTATMGPYWKRWVKNGAIDPTGGYLGGPALTFDTVSGYTTLGPGPISEDPNVALIFPADRGQPVTDGYHFVMGGYFKQGTLPATDPLPIYLVVNVESFVQSMLCVNPDGTLSVYRSIGVGATHLWTSPTALITAGTEYRLGWLGAINRINGWFDVYLDLASNPPDGSVAHRAFVPGLNTAQHDLLAWDGVGFGGDTTTKHSHLYLCQGVPEYEDPFRLGGFFVTWLQNVANGAFAQFTPNTGTMVAAVSDAPPDDAATTIEAATSGLDYTIQVDPVSLTRRIYGVQTTQRYMRPEVTSASLRSTVAIDDVVYLASGVAGGALDWDVTGGLFRVNNKTGQPWTRARLNSGVEWGGRS